MIAGALTGPSLERKGARSFVKDRLTRLGLPLVAYTVAISPLLEFVDHRFNEAGDADLWSFVRGHVWDLAPGPTWFLEVLLVFSLGCALWWKLRGARELPPSAPLSGAKVAAIALAIAASAFAIHFVFPLGSEQLHLQLAMFPQYVILFSLGVAAGRRGWLETLSLRLQRGCALAGALTALAFPVLLLAGGYFDGDVGTDRLAGGWRWEAAAAALAEGVLATCVSLWAIGYFRRHHDDLGRWARRIAPAVYGAFIVHPPVLVGLALAVQPLAVAAELKFVAVLAIGAAGSFALGGLVQRGGAVVAACAAALCSTWVAPPGRARPRRHPAPSGG